MKKTCVFLAVILLLVLVIYACEMPLSIELKTDNFEINAPVKIANFSLTSILSKALKDSFPEDFIIYDMINFPDAQAFLIAYQIDIMDSFNPDDYLNDLEMPGEKSIQETIIIPKMNTPSIEEKWFFLDMKDFFLDVESQINTDDLPKTSAAFNHPASQASFSLSNIGTFANIPSFMVFDTQNGAPDFDSVFVHTGEIVLDIWLEGVSDPNFAVELTGIDLKESLSSDNRIGNHSAPLIATITSSHTATNKYPVTITIDGEEIKKNNAPRFQLDGIKSTYAGGGSASSVGYTLCIQPRLNGITLSGARNLKIAETEEDLPDEIADEMTMIPVAELINAEIASGELKITAKPPLFQNSSTTGCDGMTIGYELKIAQDPVQTFQGLNATFTENNTSLVGKTISGASLSVDQANSKIIIKTAPNGVTFNLSDAPFPDNDGTTHNPYTEKVLPVKLGMGIDIKELTVVRWKTTLPEIESPEIDFAEMNVSFINKINFNWIKLNVNFISLPKELKDKIAMKIDCTELGFNDINKILQKGDNIFEGNSKAVLDMSNPNTVTFDAKLIPVIGGTTTPDSPYIEVGPVIMGDDDIEMEIKADISVEFEWKSAEIDVKAALGEMDEEMMEGTIPEEDEAIDLSVFGDYMEGITFSKNLKAKIFLSGMPDRIVKQIKPQLTLKAEWKDDEKIISDKQTLKGGIELPSLPQKINGKWEYTDTELPQGDGLVLTGFDEIIAAFPESLWFTYKLELNEDPVTVYRNDFKDVKDDSKIRALLVVLLPLDLVAGDEGGFLKMPGLFEDNKNGEDLFGRKNPHDKSLFTGFNIESLRMKIDFRRSFFAGASLHFDKGDDEGNKLFGEKGRFLGDGDSLSITFTEEEHKFINEHLIYPDVKFEFPPGKKLRIARDPLPVRIVITASGSYTLDFEDIGDLFGSGN